MPPDLLVLICDTARADAFSPWGSPLPSPSVETLCREGTMYEQGSSVAPWTLPSTVSMLSGQLPTEHGINGDCLAWTDGLPSAPAQALKAFSGPWLPEELRERGYRTWGVSCNRWVSGWGGFDRGFDEFVDARGWTRLAGFKPGRRIRKLRRISGTVDRGGKEALAGFGRRLADAGPEPLFAFVNLMEVHAPYYPPPRFNPALRRGTGSLSQRRRLFHYQRRQGRRRPPGDPGYGPAIRQLYQGAARYEDWLVGGFVAAVRDRGRPTALALVSDHGENLGEHGLFSHNSSLHQTLLRVPLALWGQGVDLAGGRVAGPVSLLGLAGWLRAAADGAASPMEGDGAVVGEYESTVHQLGLPAVERAFRHVDPGAVPPLVRHPGLAVRRGDLKYVATEDGTEALFDLADDPGEERDLMSARPDVAARFRGDLDEWRARRARQPRYLAGDVAEGEIAEHLRELGYID